LESRGFGEEPASARVRPSAANAAKRIASIRIAYCSSKGVAVGGDVAANLLVEQTIRRRKSEKNAESKSK
jgi:hypothetical protein